MPSYTYQCLECKTNKIIIRGINDQEEVYLCDTCNSKLNRVYSTIGVTFKGSGFYSKDK